MRQSPEVDGPHRLPQVSRNGALWKGMTWTNEQIL